MLSRLLLCWVVLRLHAPCTCFPLQQEPSPDDVLAEDLEEHRQAEEEASTNYLKRKNVNERAQRITHQESKGIITHLKNPTKGCFSVLNVKSNKFLCLDSERKLYTSEDDSNEDCWFHRINRHKHYRVFQSCTGDVMIILNQKNASVHTLDSSELSSFISIKRHKKRTNHRKRRSWHIDPSDPLGSEYPYQKTINSQKREPEYSSNIFKETIALVDDPLQVLLPHSPLSPTLEKNWRNKKFRF
ncbi:fibroblast growth factor 23-like [Astyanax mexicanus]|uniref:Fibroblast growth factor 23-like n=1 Tax=Astyanax mexicanus TaxID=7994 RepID=A0A8T2LRE8_ASTMX|nr:fibroblast growth factor 23-like [Astyanax mexicanus]